MSDSEDDPRSDIEKIYDEILDEKGSEIYFKPANEYFEIGTELSVAEAVVKCYEKGEIMIGYKINAYEQRARLRHGIDINPPKDTKITFGEMDKVIVISEIQYYEEND